MNTQPIPLYELCIGVFFIIWLAITVICQFDGRKLSTAIRAYDGLNLIPLWTFFAPNPGTQDYHLLYRDKGQGDTPGEWHEIDIQEERYFFSCIWNPDKRDKKVLADVVQDLITMVQSTQHDTKFLIVTLPYLTILKAVCTKEKTVSNAAERQFMLAGSHGFNSTKAPEFILLSMFHPV